jgi:hypothetical protein
VVKNQSMRDACTSVVAGDVEPLETQMVHDAKLVRSRQPLGVG